jgi:hypothetical protein
MTTEINLSLNILHIHNYVLKGLEHNDRDHLEPLSEDHSLQVTNHIRWQNILSASDTISYMTVIEIYPDVFYKDSRLSGRLFHLDLELFLVLFYIIVPIFTLQEITIYS